MSTADFVAHRRLANVRAELNLAKAWLNDKGHTLDCGQQDAAIERIRELEEEVRDLEDGLVCPNCDAAAPEPGSTFCRFCNA